jgi:hypothetical protein
MEQLTLFKYMEQTRNRFGYIVNEQGRECSKCGEFRLWSFFYKDQKSKSGYMSFCKECFSLVSKKRSNDPNRIELFNNIKREYVYGDVREDGMVFSDYRISGSPEKNFERWMTKETYETHKQQNKNAVKNRKLRYLKIEKKYKKGDVRDDGMKFWEYSQIHASTNFEKWVTERDFELLKFNSRKKNYIRQSLGKFGGRDEPTDKIIGLNKNDFSCYIESLFEDGMTWDNRGGWEGEWDPENPKWHLDHILPLSSVDNLEDKKHLWHYTNLRPMWGNKNLSKSNKHCPEQLEAFLKERKAESMV